MGEVEHGSSQSLGRPQRSRWMRGVASGVMILGAMALVLFAGRLFFTQPEEEETPPLPSNERPTVAPLGIESVQYPTAYPTVVITATPAPVDWVRPTAEPDVIAAALDNPVVNASGDGVVDREVDALTILPARSRSDITTYEVQSGDTLQIIADHFGIQQSTIIWSNDRFYVNAMSVGMELNILPVDGVYYTVTDPETISDLAEEFQVAPYDIIDSEFNNLFGATPDMVLPAGLRLIIPGGIGSQEPVYWDPGIVQETSGSSSGGTGGVTLAQGFASFAAGDPGSCGRQAVYGGTLPVGAPIYRSYRITQDFTWVHGGIDLAVPAGTPVFAAGGGTVIFSGWSTWGYGYTVVIAHGGTLTLYGHLNGAFVSCGEVVTAGQNIAVTGSTGRSSGPHLHFEIRDGSGRPTSPWSYQSF
ncbi:MAG TPA: peptidoglycan DD-metalloendopeptidase family protein [Aggregatilinea sp.]|uniref:peptidoglycan DD-metalloendopeptidase family protein n=1 Tax=Aggregatilinea sp. TaxID=2806333 RepID=UPI002B7C7308|nr:peptidoglycan DD-metalloendopeptidase family protein [Aggregatilinea sp.]HML23571.1 peptidoglycan DD-metalloendopeptidase family protein [Aggregatilinea sp.]